MIVVPRLRFVDEIVLAVADLYGVLPADIRGRSRTKGLSEARQCVCLVARRCTRLSFTELGQALNRDHTTIMASTRSALRRMWQDQWFQQETEALLKRFSPVGGETPS